MSEPPRLFLSYSKADEALASRLGEDLERSGIRVTDVRSFEPGAAVEDRVQEEIRFSDAVLLLVSPGSRQSQWQQVEWRAALEAAWDNPRLKILPVLLGDAELPAFVRSTAPEIQAVRLEDAGDLREATRAILDSLEQGAFRSAATRSAPAVELEDDSLGVGQVFRGEPRSLRTRSAGVSLETYSSVTEEDRSEIRERFSQIKDFAERLR